MAVMVQTIQDTKVIPWCSSLIQSRKLIWESPFHGLKAPAIQKATIESQSWCYTTTPIMYMISVHCTTMLLRLQRKKSLALLISLQLCTTSQLFTQSSVHKTNCNVQYQHQFGSLQFLIALVRAYSITKTNLTCILQHIKILASLQSQRFS